MAWIRGCIITLVAFVWLFSTMHYQMCFQMTSIRGCVFALVAFVLFFYAVCFQMNPQMACIRKCIFTLLAFIWFHAISCRFHKDFHACIIYTFVIIFRNLLHCRLGFAQCNHCNGCFKLKPIQTSEENLELRKIESEVGESFIWEFWDGTISQSSLVVRFLRNE